MKVDWTRLGVTAVLIIGGVALAKLVPGTATEVVQGIIVPLAAAAMKSFVVSQ